MIVTYVSIGAGVLALSLAALIVMLARRSRLGRWLTAALEVLMVLFGLIVLPADLEIGFLFRSASGSPRPPPQPL